MALFETEQPYADMEPDAESWDQWFERMKRLEASKTKPRPPEATSFAFMID